MPMWKGFLKEVWMWSICDNHSVDASWSVQMIRCVEGSWRESSNSMVDPVVMEIGSSLLKRPSNELEDICLTSLSLKSQFWLIGS